MARVTAKTPVKTFTTGTRNGSLFSIDLLDKDGGEIRASFFNKAADKFYTLIEQGKVYKLSKGNVKVANKQFSSCNHNYEINFDDDAIIELQEDEAGIESIKYNFVRIRDLQSKSLPSTVDIIGVVRDIKMLGKVNSKQGEEMSRRTVTVVDSSDCAVEVTLWQDQAMKFDEAALNSKPVIALKGVSLREYNGRTCSTTPSSQVELNPSIPETTETRAWWDSHGCTSATVFNISQAGSGRASVGGMGPQVTKDCNIGEMREDCSKGFMAAGAGLSFETVGYLSFVTTRAKETGETPIFYDACVSCNRKLPDDRRCVACDKVMDGQSRYLLRAQFMDHTSDCYLSVFHDQAVSLLHNKPVKDFIDAKSSGKGTSEELKSCYWRQPWVLKVRAKSDEYKGELKSKVQLVGCEMLDYAAQTRKMLKKLEARFGSFAPTATFTSNDEENLDHTNIKRRKIGDSDVADEVSMTEV